MKKVLGALVLFSVVSTVSGCVTRGTDFPSDTQWIKNKETSQVDVSLKLGRPFKVGSANGTPTWTYGFYKHNIFGESLIKELKIYFDGTKKVTHYSFSSSFPRDGAVN